jgi:hypothetical protein
MGDELRKRKKSIFFLMIVLNSYIGTHVDFFKFEDNRMIYPKSIDSLELCHIDADISN